MCCLVTPNAVEVHGQVISPGRTYVLSRYLVTEPGLGVHDRFHLRLDELTSVDLISVPFADRVFNLRAPSEIPTCVTFAGTIYGLLILLNSWRELPSFFSRV